MGTERVLMYHILYTKAGTKSTAADTNKLDLNNAVSQKRLVSKSLNLGISIKKFLSHKKGTVTIPLPCNIFFVLFAGTDVPYAGFNALFYRHTGTIRPPVSFKVHRQPFNY